ncbi:MAG: SDR family oxidoreductase [Planctomycetota bacterium]
MIVGLTGASGFLGKALRRQLISDGHSVIAWTSRPKVPSENPPDQSWESARPLKATSVETEWRHGTLGCAEDAAAFVHGCDAVIHAGLSRTGKSFLDVGENVEAYWHRNVTGSLQLLEAANSAGVQRFVFVSSGAVHDIVVPDHPLDETHPARPKTLYGAYKASVESLVHHYGSLGTMVTATLRPTAIYGLADPPESSRWWSLVQDVAGGKSVTATGGSKCVHVEDVASGCRRLLRHDGVESGSTYNCCDAMFSDYRVAEITGELLDRPVKLFGAPKQAKHQIITERLESLGMQFGGEPLLRETIRAMLPKQSGTA